MDDERTEYVLQFFEAKDGANLLPDWNDFAFESCEANRDKDIVINHWKKHAPNVGKPWRIIKRIETVLENPYG